jgi:alpha-mannosidase
VRRDFNLRGPAYPVPYQISEPVAGNFYPVNTVASLEDEAAGVSLHVVVDRAMGAASLANGEVEVMVHRRVQQDDNRGVGR